MTKARSPSGQSNGLLHAEAAHHLHGRPVAHALENRACHVVQVAAVKQLDAPPSSRCRGRSRLPASNLHRPGPWTTVLSPLMSFCAGRLRGGAVFTPTCFLGCTSGPQLRTPTSASRPSGILHGRKKLEKSSGNGCTFSLMSAGYFPHGGKRQVEEEPAASLFLCGSARRAAT